MDRKVTSQRRDVAKERRILGVNKCVGKRIEFIDVDRSRFAKMPSFSNESVVAPQREDSMSSGLDLLVELEKAVDLFFKRGSCDPGDPCAKYKGSFSPLCKSPKQRPIVGQ